MLVQDQGYDWQETYDPHNRYGQENRDDKRKTDEGICDDVP